MYTKHTFNFQGKLVCKAAVPASAPTGAVWTFHLLCFCRSDHQSPDAVILGCVHVCRSISALLFIYLLPSFLFSLSSFLFFSLGILAK